MNREAVAELAEAMARILGLSLDAADRDAVTQHLTIAADMARLLETLPAADADMPLPMNPLPAFDR